MNLLYDSFIKKLITEYSVQSTEYSVSCRVITIQWTDLVVVAQIIRDHLLYYQGSHLIQ
jgi:hypothetical protein